MTTMAVLVNPATGEAMPQQLAAGGLTTLAQLGAQLLCGTTAGAVGVNAPAAPVEGSCFAAVDNNDNAGAHAITVNGNGNLIDGAASFVLATNGEVAFFIFDRAQWRQLFPLRRLDVPGGPVFLGLRLLADAPVGPVGPAGPTGPAGPGNIFSGVGGGNVGTITATEVDSTAISKTPLMSLLGGVAVAAGITTDVGLFTVGAPGRWRVDAVATATNVDGGSGANFTVRANFMVQAGPTLSMISGGTDENPDSSNTAGVDFQLDVSGSSIVCRAINGAGVNLQFGWEVRAQEQLF